MDWADLGTVGMNNEPTQCSPMHVALALSRIDCSRSEGCMRRWLYMACCRRAALLSLALDEATHIIIHQAHNCHSFSRCGNSAYWQWMKSLVWILLFLLVGTSCNLTRRRSIHIWFYVCVGLIKGPYDLHLLHLLRFRAWIMLVLEKILPFVSNTDIHLVFRGHVHDQTGTSTYYFQHIRRFCT